MCDTVLVPATTSLTGSVLFAKNSDRQRNEAQRIDVVPAGEHLPREKMRCTYLEIPQVKCTNAAIFVRPYWVWGAEMGANEHGVVIGNEGLVARRPSPEAPALSGMDLVRLALERAQSASEAVAVITDLLEEWGQGGNCGHITPAFYNNAFMIADRAEAFILETVDRQWLCERVDQAISISNLYSIAHPTSASLGAPLLLSDLGASTLAGSYATGIQEPDREHIGQARARRDRAAKLLEQKAGRVALADLFALLRDHGSEAGWDPATASYCTICMHAGTRSDGTQRDGQTTGSLVSELGPSGLVVWVTGTSAPCISIFKPLFLDVALPAGLNQPRGEFDERSLWWRHEKLHRAALRADFLRFVTAIADERDELEARFRVKALEGLEGARRERQRVVDECWREAALAEERWKQQLVDRNAVPTTYWTEWSRLSQLAAMP